MQVSRLSKGRDMKVICKYDNLPDLPEKYSRINAFDETIFGLILGKEYIVYGQSLDTGGLGYLLVEGDEPFPCWYPAVLFNVTDQRIPSNWIFDYLRENEEYGVSAIWGYEELIKSAHHFDRLCDRAADALEIFLRRKRETDEIS